MQETEKKISKYCQKIKYKANKAEELVTAVRYILHGNTLFEDTYNPVLAVLDCLGDELSNIKADISYYEHLLSKR